MKVRAQENQAEVLKLKILIPEKKNTLLVFTGDLSWQNKELVT